MSKIFLSHTSVDKPFVRKLAADLRNYGHTVWIDEAEINIGDSLIGKIRDGLDSVDYVAAVLSKTSIKSEWVKKELEIASNREIKEKRVVVLPILIENVDLPGFLEGKFYGDFSNDVDYPDKLKLLLRSLGDSNLITTDNQGELDNIKYQLKLAQLTIERNRREINKVINHSFLIKSDNLKENILKENKNHPEFAPINNVYAFEIGNSSITIGYLLHATAKASMRGSHPLEMLLTLENKWDEATRMLEAYSEMIHAQIKK